MDLKKHPQSWIFGEAFSCEIFFGWSSLFFSVAGLELSVLAEGILGGLEFVSWTTLGVGFLPSFGDHGHLVNGVCRKLQNNENGWHISKKKPEWRRKNYR